VIQNQNMSRQAVTQGDAPSDPVPVRRQLAAEIFGTFVGTFSTIGPTALSATFNLHMDYISLTICTALGAMVSVYAVGRISGAHTNPAVTIAFALRGDFGWRRVPGYIAAQFAGSLAAAYTVIGILKPARHALLPQVRFGTLAAVELEVVMTALLIVVCLGVAKSAAFIGPDAAIAMGAITAVDRITGYYVSGASMNPARTLGPIIAERGAPSWWIYLVGPLLGTVVGVVVTFLVCGRPTRDEAKKSHGG
jgi:aquaporin Z